MQLLESNRFFAPALRTLLVGTGLFLFAETVVYPGVIRNNLFIPPLLLALIPLLVRVLFPKTASLLVPNALQKKLFLLPSLILVVQFVCTLLDYFVHPNFIYSSTSLHPTGLIPLSAYLMVSAWTLVSGQVQKKQSELRVFLLPFWGFFFLFPFRWIYVDVWRDLIREDSLVEYLTMAAYAVGAVVAFVTAATLHSRKKLSLTLRYPLILALLLLGIGAILFAGEEISWGQRLLGIETPEYLAERNTQQELNLHNNRAVFGYVYTAYGVVAFLGMTAWIYRWILHRMWPKSWIARFAQLTLPSWELLGFFIPTYCFVRLRTEPVHPEVIAWEETTELFLAFGIALSIYWIYRRVTQKSSN